MVRRSRMKSSKLKTGLPIIERISLMATTINTSNVTIEQLDRVERVYDYNARQHFCIVKSESDDLVEYHVRYDKAHKCFTCSCPSGQEGFANVRNANAA